MRGPSAQADRVLDDLHTRSRMSFVSYPISDIAFQLDGGRRSFATAPLVEFIECCVKCDTWKEVGGLGSMHADAATETLGVRQTAEGHAAVRAHLEQLRARQRSLAPGRKRDLPALYRALDRDQGIIMRQDIRTNAVVIRGLSAGRERYGDWNSLLESLSARPRTAFRDGILLDVSGWGAADLDEGLTRFCQTRDVDLFVDRHSCQVEWVVRASDSVYEE